MEEEGWGLGVGGRVQIHIHGKLENMVSICLSCVIMKIKLHVGCSSTVDLGRFFVVCFLLLSFVVVVFCCCFLLLFCFLLFCLFVCLFVVVVVGFIYLFILIFFVGGG